MDKINLENKRILITGGNGYLGSILKNELKKYTDFVFSISNVGIQNETEFVVDITHKEALQTIVSQINPDIVYHLAALIDRNRDYSIFAQMNNVNVMGTSYLIDALTQTDCTQFIFASTSEVYGNNTSPFSENMQLQPVSPYSLSKAMAELLIQTRLRNSTINYSIARIFNFYGPNMSENFFINEMIQTLSKGEAFKMTLGEQFRDYLFVDDVISALISMIQQNGIQNEIINICSGKGIKIKDIALEVQKYFPSKILFGAIPYRENEVWEMIGNAEKVKEKLNFVPKISLSVGISKLIEIPKL
jgi:nucleoside-diphosphate-sugar epimerase